MNNANSYTITPAELTTFNTVLIISVQPPYSKNTTSLVCVLIDYKH